MNEIYIYIYIYIYIDDEFTASNEEVCKDFLMLCHLVRVGRQKDFWCEHGVLSRTRKQMLLFVF